MSNPYTNFGDNDSGLWARRGAFSTAGGNARYNAILNKRYQYYHNTHPDGGEIAWEERTDKNPDVNFLADIYFQKDLNDIPFGTQGKAHAINFTTDFKSFWTEQQSFSIFQQEFEHHLNMALSSSPAM